MTLLENDPTVTHFDTKELTMHIDSPERRSVLVEPREPDSTSPPGARAPVARCADGHGTMTGLFFSDNVVDIARAKAMCGLCPLQASCLAGALEREEPWGVWGGELLSGGRIIANKRPCGRPPKHPRPAVVIDELGPVAVA
ncbi:MAG TPA: WhiB family transcriptional regulator [Ilumatobacteraceae bacterium]|nr:WhiB family transcriptional regulator [Ilumatobacteraceae bacterium]